jgi:hypothetical protein
MAREGDFDVVKVLGEAGCGRAMLVRRRQTGNMFVMKEVRLANLKP